MKILFFIHSLSAGGAERVLSLLVNEWVSYGHEIIIITAKNTKFYQIDASIKIILSNNYIEKKYFNNPITRNIKGIINYKKLIVEVDPDIIISFMTTMNILTTIAAKLAKKKIILSEHTNFDRLDSNLWRSFRRVIYPLSEYLVVLTYYDKEKYSFHKNVTVIENPIFLWNKNFNSKRENIILAVGRLNKVKGFDLLLKAFAQLKNIDDWKLVILGEGPEQNNLELLGEQLNISKYISMLGNIKNIDEYYYKSKIFVLSSRAEGFPVSLCEAMSCGCAPVAFKCKTGPEEIIEHLKNGLLVENGNIDQLSKNIQYLVDNHEKMKIFGEEAIKIKDRLSVSLISKKWFNIIEKVLVQK